MSVVDLNFGYNLLQGQYKSNTKNKYNENGKIWSPRKSDVQER